MAIYHAASLKLTMQNASPYLGLALYLGALNNGAIRSGCEICLHKLAHINFAAFQLICQQFADTVITGDEE